MTAQERQKKEKTEVKKQPKPKTTPQEPKADPQNERPLRPA